MAGDGSAGDELKPIPEPDENEWGWSPIKTVRSIRQLGTSIGKWGALLLGSLTCAIALSQQGSSEASAAIPYPIDSMDLKDAHVDVRAFLLELSKLGRSAAEDQILLAKIAARAVHPVRDERPRFRGVRETHHAYLLLRGSRQLAGNMAYTYGTTDAGVYKAAVRIDLNSEFACIRVKDLMATLGAPARLIKYPPSPHVKKTGPSDVWEAIYALNSRGESWFSFSTKECAWHFAFLPVRS